MTAAPICAWCKQPTKGLATIGDDHYCHEGDSPTCYESAQTFLALNAGQMSRAGSFLDGLLDDQRQQWQERHGDETFATAQAFERLNDDRLRDAQALQAAHALAHEWINDDAEPATDHGVTAQIIRNACGQQLLAALNKRSGSGGSPGGINRYCTECRRWTDHEGPQHLRYVERASIHALFEAAAEQSAAAETPDPAPRDDVVYEAYASTCPICAQPGPEEPRLREEEHELLFDALGDFGTNSPEVHPDLPDIGSLIGAVVPVAERILAKRLAAVEQERDGWKRAYEVTDRRVTGHVQERVTLVQRLHAAEQERDLATATAADAVAKLDALATEKQRLSERAANDLLALTEAVSAELDRIEASTVWDPSKEHVPYPHVLDAIKQVRAVLARGDRLHVEPAPLTVVEEVAMAEAEAARRGWPDADPDRLAKALLAVDYPSSAFDQLTDHGRAKWRSRADRLVALLNEETPTA